MFSRQFFTISEPGDPLANRPAAYFSFGSG